MFERKLRSELDALPAVMREVRDYVRAEGVLDDATIYAIELALDELVGNTIRYGYDSAAPGAGQIVVEVSVGVGEVRVVVRDDAKPFDPTRAATPPESASLEEAPVGGLGIHLVRQRIPDMRYQRIDGHNQLELVLPRERASSD